MTRKVKVFKMRLFGVIFNHCAMKKMKFLMQICIISPVFSPRISSLTHPSSTLLSSRLFCSQPDGFSDCFSICIDEIVEYAHNAAQSSTHCGNTTFLFQKVNFDILFTFVCLQFWRVTWKFGIFGQEIEFCRSVHC